MAVFGQLVLFTPLPHQVLEDQAVAVPVQLAQICKTQALAAAVLW
jgi:hypothetical protein